MRCARSVCGGMDSVLNAAGGSDNVGRTSNVSAPLQPIV